MRKDIKKQIINRLKILEGQVRGLQNMVKKEKYCVKILQQSGAVKEAISGVEDLILKNHLSTHVVEQIKSGKTQKAIGEIMSVYQLSKGRRK